MLNSRLNSVLLLDMHVNKWALHRPCSDSHVAELRGAVMVLRRLVLCDVAHNTDAESIDADLLVEAYVQSGAPWQALTNAVNSRALTGATRRITE